MMTCWWCFAIMCTQLEQTNAEELWGTWEVVKIIRLSFGSFEDYDTLLEFPDNIRVTFEFRRNNANGGKAIVRFNDKVILEDFIVRFGTIGKHKVAYAIDGETAKECVAFYYKFDRGMLIFCDTLDKSLSPEKVREIDLFSPLDWPKHYLATFTVLRRQPAQAPKAPQKRQ